ncbi:hypothetical protein [Butyrivibrio sp. VCB2006]|uniref:hypothetical protein n=1 Tax=Butyrivibrio sp. VCB2006 TaxID=1280679 RepID=UPI000421FE9A|nr:hypothetical protein [Butyrivibrio sp. VCB2006]
MGKKISIAIIVSLLATGLCACTDGSTAEAPSVQETESAQSLVSTVPEAVEEVVEEVTEKVEETTPVDLSEAESSIAASDAIEEKEEVLSEKKEAPKKEETKKEETKVEEQKSEDLSDMNNFSGDSYEDSDDSKGCIGDDGLVW